MSGSNLWRMEPLGTGVLASGRWFWPRATMWMIGLFAFAALALFASFQLGDWLHLPRGSSWFTGILVPAAALAAYALAVNIGERRGVSELDPAKAPISLLLGGMVGFAFMAMSLLLLWLFGFVGVARGHWRDWFSYLVFNSYISAVVEELGFRRPWPLLC
jgi:hypothetical protein